MNAQDLEFRRSLGSLLLSVSVLVLTAVFLLWFSLDADQSPMPMPTLVILLFFLAVSAWLTVGNLGDRIEITPGTIRQSNVLLERLGFGSREVEFENIEGLREHRGRALFLVVKGGRPMVLDSIGRYEELKAILVERTGLQVYSRKTSSMDAARDSSDERHARTGWFGRGPE